MKTVFWLANRFIEVNLRNWVGWNERHGCSDVYEDGGREQRLDGGVSQIANLVERQADPLPTLNNHEVGHTCSHEVQSGCKACYTYHSMGWRNT